MASSNSCLHEQLGETALVAGVPRIGRLFLVSPTPGIRERQEPKVREMVMPTRMGLRVWLSQGS